MSTTGSSKRTKIIYWVVTVIFLLPTAGSAIPELFVGGPDSTAKILITLGYPLYLMRILGFAKIMGAIAIATDKPERLKEWAYAGFTFEFLGAAASHVLAGDAAHALPPLVFLVLMSTSYVFWKKKSRA
jgi:hypothetical protein